MIYSSLDSSHQDKSNDSKIIQIGMIFVEIAIFKNFGSGQVRSGQLYDPTQNFSRVRYLTRADPIRSLLIPFFIFSIQSAKVYIDLDSLIYKYLFTNKTSN